MFFRYNNISSDRSYSLCKDDITVGFFSFLSQDLYWFYANGEIVNKGDWRWYLQ